MIQIRFDSARGIEGIRIDIERERDYIEYEKMED